MNLEFIISGVVRTALFFVGFAVAGSLAHASPVTLDFEGFLDSTILTTQYPGVTFTNAIILASGISLNEFEFPPHSGVNVVSDNGGPITIDFSTPITSFGGYFTYLEPLMLDAFDAADDQVGTTTSAYSTNDALYGDPGSSPNEFIQLSFTGGISSIIVTGDPAGGSFTLDDVTYAGPIYGAPESGTVHLLIAAAITLLTFYKGTKSKL